MNRPVSTIQNLDHLKSTSEFNLMTHSVKCGKQLCVNMFFIISLISDFKKRDLSYTWLFTRKDTICLSSHRVV